MSGSGPRETTLAAHLAAEAAARPPLSPALGEVLRTLAGAGVRIAGELARAAFTGRLGDSGAVNTHGDRVKRLDAWANDLLVEALADGGRVAAVASEELAAPLVVGGPTTAERFVVCLDPIDGSLNTDVNGVLGTIFGVRRAAGGPGADPAAAALAPGRTQVAAGYLLYGPATLFVYAAGRGVHGFALDPDRGELRLTDAAVRMPDRGRTYAVNDGNWSRWGPGPRALVEWLRQRPEDGPPYSLRYSGALVADFHRTLREGGLYFYPAEPGTERADGRIRLLYEAAPLALVAEAAGGRASTGTGRILDVAARHPHQRVPLYVGSRLEVDRAEACLRAAADAS